MIIWGIRRRLRRCILNVNKAVRCSISGRFSNFDKCRPEAEAAGDAISGMAFDYVGADSLQALVILGWIVVDLFDWPAAPVLRTFVQYSIA